MRAFHLEKNGQKLRVLAIFFGARDDLVRLAAAEFVDEAEG